MIMAIKIHDNDCRARDQHTDVLVVGFGNANPIVLNLYRVKTAILQAYLD